MKTLACLISFVAVWAVLFVIPAAVICLIFDINYHEVIMSAAYLIGGGMVFALIGAIFVVAELYDDIVVYFR